MRFQNRSIGIGLSTIDPAAGDTPGATTFGVGAGIWWVVSNLIALIIGGYVAARLSGMPLRGDGIIHGVLTWAVTLLEVNGKTSPADATRGFEFVFTADKVTRKKGGKVESETGYRLDLARKPRWIDFTDLSGKEKEKTFAAIYELDKDTMKLCFRVDVKKTNKRAAKFDSGEGSGQVLMVLTRKKC